MTRVMRRHTDALNRVDQRVFCDAGILFGDLGQDAGDLFLLRLGQGDLTALERLHRFVAGPSRCEKDNRRSEISLAERRDQINRMNRRRHAVSFPLR